MGACKLRGGSPANAVLARVAALESLDVAAGRLATMLGGVPAGRVKSTLGGAWLGHSVHPMLVVVPIGAWTSATVLDVVGGAASARASRLLIGVGVAAAVPTAMTGLLDWSDRAPDHDAVRRVGLLHAATNSTALCLYGGSLIARRRDRHARGVHLAVAGFGVLSFGDWLGGHLALARGMGANQTAFATLPRAWTAVGDASVLTAGQPARATAGELDVVLVPVDGKLCALLNRCSHCGGLLHLGDVLGDCIVCPRHGTRFGLQEGSLRHGPGAYPQPSLQVRVRGNRVEVRAPPA